VCEQEFITSGLKWRVGSGKAVSPAVPQQPAGGRRPVKPGAAVLPAYTRRTEVDQRVPDRATRCSRTKLITCDGWVAAGDALADAVMPCCRHGRPSARTLLGTRPRCAQHAGIMVVPGSASVAPPPHPHPPTPSCLVNLQPYQWRRQPNEQPAARKGQRRGRPRNDTPACAELREGLTGEGFTGGKAAHLTRNW
jgi:hypothetical protein